MNVEVILAPNPSLLTGPGTNTWLATSGGEAIVVDPGPLIDSHLDAIVGLLGDRTPRAVVVTHTHPDHAPAANPLADRLGVPAIGFDDGPGFSPDRRIADGGLVDFGDEAMRCVTTPGHTRDSVSYRSRDKLFTGDHIMGGSTVIVEDMSAYLNSLQRLKGSGLGMIYPGHGPVIDAPDAIIGDYIAHRLEREGQIIDALGSGAISVGEIVLKVYADVEPELHPFAAMSVASHLTKLSAEGKVRVAPDPVWESEVRLR